MLVARPTSHRLNLDSNRSSPELVLIRRRRRMLVVVVVAELGPIVVSSRRPGLLPLEFVLANRVDSPPPPPSPSLE